MRDKNNKSNQPEDEEISTGEMMAIVKLKAASDDAVWRSYGIFTIGGQYSECITGIEKHLEVD